MYLGNPWFLFSFPRDTLDDLFTSTNLEGHIVGEGLFLSEINLIFSKFSSSKRKVNTRFISGHNQSPAKWCHFDFNVNVYVSYSHWYNNVTIKWWVLRFTLMSSLRRRVLSMLNNLNTYLNDFVMVRTDEIGTQTNIISKYIKPF